MGKAEWILAALLSSVILVALVSSYSSGQPDNWLYHYQTLVIGILTLGSAIAAAILLHRQTRQVSEIAKETKSDQGRFLALRLAVIFEDYSSECMDAYFDHDSASGSEGQIGRYASYLPIAPTIPQDDANWPALDHDASQRAFSFAGTIRQFNEKVRFHAEVTGDIDSDEVISKLFEVAESAFLLSGDLRRRHQVGGLEESDARIRDMREWRDEHRAKLLRKEERRSQRRAERVSVWIGS